LTLIIPAHNEESRLSATLDLYAEALAASFGPRFEVLVVVNGSRDRTAAVARMAMRRWPQIRLIDIPAPVGKGGAVLEGFRRARGRYVAFTDADAATAAESLVELVRGLRTHDVVIGSRRLPRSIITRAQPPARRLLGHLFAGVARVLLRLPYRDTQCGAKAFRAEAAQILAELVREQFWTFDLDLLLTARDLGLDVAEVPVRWADQPGSRLQLWPTLQLVLPSLWRLARRSPRRSAAATGRAFASVASGESTHDRTLAHSRV
jgi:glycosyltransferase involved in cell wall biosynthesis